MEYLRLFKDLNRLGRQDGYAVGTESQIFDLYDDLIGINSDRDRKTYVIAHCHDEVIMSNGLRKNLLTLERDLTVNPNVHLILISCYDITDQLPKLPNLLFIPFIEYHAIYWPLYSDIEPADASKIDYRFLSLNKRADVYRQLLYYKFHKERWLDTNIFSYGCEDKWKGNMLDKASYDEMHAIARSFPSMQHLCTDVPRNGILVKGDVLLEQYSNGMFSKDPTWLIEKAWYDSTFCSVVIETNAGDVQINLSEKTFRCIAMQHPMVLFASPGTKKFLDRLGLDVGIDMQAWDHPGNNRLGDFMHVLDEINSYSIPVLTSTRYALKERLESSRKAYSEMHSKMLLKQDEMFELINDQLLRWR